MPGHDPVAGGMDHAHGISYPPMPTSIDLDLDHTGDVPDVCFEEHGGSLFGEDMAAFV